MSLSFPLVNDGDPDKKNVRFDLFCYTSSEKQTEILLTDSGHTLQQLKVVIALLLFLPILIYSVMTSMTSVYTSQKGIPGHLTQESSPKLTISSY